MLKIIKLSLFQFVWKVNKKQKVFYKNSEQKELIKILFKMLLNSKKKIQCLKILKRMQKIYIVE